MYSKKHCKKLEAQGSRLSFSFSSDFIVILQPVRITPVLVQFAKDTRKTKKNISRQNLEQKQHNNGSQKAELYFPQKLCNCFRLIKSVYHVSSVFVFITTSNGNAWKISRKHHEKRYSFTSIDKGHIKNPTYSKARDQDLRIARNIAKKLEAQGSRLSFSFSSDFIVILQPLRITLFGKICKRYEKNEKKMFPDKT